MLDLSLELCNILVDGMLRCPVCHARLGVSKDRHSLVCNNSFAEKKHCFDGGRSGYVSLCRTGSGGDSKEAVRSRNTFLAKGYYFHAADMLVKIAEDHLALGSRIIDAGCGEGYYSNILADRRYFVLGADLSKFAVDTAAKSAKRLRMSNGIAQSSTAYVAASVFELPVFDGCADGVVNMFAPCVPEEYARVLRPGGILIVGAAGKDHLMGLKRVLYDDPYLNDERRDLPCDDDAFFSFVERRKARFEITVEGREDIDALFSMTPYYWRTSRDGEERLLAHDRLTTEVAFDFTIYRRKI